MGCQRKLELLEASPGAFPTTAVEMPSTVICQIYIQFVLVNCYWFYCLDYHHHEILFCKPLLPFALGMHLCPRWHGTWESRGRDCWNSKFIYHHLSIWTKLYCHHIEYLAVTWLISKQRKHIIAKGKLKQVAACVIMVVQPGNSGRKCRRLRIHQLYQGHTLSWHNHRMGRKKGEKLAESYGTVGLLVFLLLTNRCQSQMTVPVHGEDAV